MANEADATTQALTGQLALILLVSAPLAFLVSILLLGVFKRAVKRSMMRSVGAHITEIAPAHPPQPPAAAITMTNAGEHVRGDPLLAAPSALAYLLGGLAYAMVATWTYSTANNLQFTPPEYAWFALLHFWPSVIAIGLASVSTLRGRLLLLIGYLALIVVAVVAAYGSVSKVGPALLAWVLVNGAGTVLMLAFFARPIRAIGPLALVFMIALIGGANFVPGFIGGDLGRLDWVARVSLQVGLDATLTYFGLVAAGAIAMAVIGGLALLGIGKLYSDHLITDQTMLPDSVFLLFALLHAMELVFAGPIWFYSGLIGFAAYKLVSVATFALVRPRAKAPPRRLLLLRVFSLGKRSEQLFDAFGKLWRRKGPIRMIAGPDLVASTVEPHEFLDFLQGKLSRRFIGDEAALDRRLAEGEEARRFDGRYGVVELFCHDDTWKMALRRLVRDSDAVLMDLRGFAPNNRGCVYEVEALFDLAPLSRIVFVVDKTTDDAFLRATFAASWAKISERSPNRSDPAPHARVFNLGAQGNDARRLVATVIAGPDNRT